MVWYDRTGGGNRELRTAVVWVGVELVVVVLVDDVDVDVLVDEVVGVVVVDRVVVLCEG
jgi:hypothetical protein